MASKEMIQALAVTAELMGNEMTPAAARMMCDDLGAYPDNLVIDALQRVRREVKGRLSISDIIQRIDDGRVGVEEAWAMMPITEDQSVVWTEEMSAAFFVALPIIEQGDMIAARMAFKEVYLREVQRAKTDQKPVKWSVSLGHAESGRESVLLEAVQKKRISYDDALYLCPAIEQSAIVSIEGVAKLAALTAQANIKAV